MPPDPIRSGASLTNLFGRWVTPGDVDRPAVVLIHGFTANGSYLLELASFLEEWGYRSLLFEFDSYLGIDTAAVDLAARLLPISDELSQHGLVFVAHSMGGLVARVFIRQAEANTPLSSAIRGLCTLGAPHAGTLNDQTVIRRLADWSDLLTGIYPFLRSPTCRSATQLTGTDSERLIETLNAADRESPLRIPTLTVSGGLGHLEVAPGLVKNHFANQYLQRVLSTPNDGLVTESSADLRAVLGRSDLPIEHFNSYPEYARTNHSYLVRNQTIAQRIVEWCRRCCPAT